jgi:hypothetical protein
MGEGESSIVSLKNPRLDWQDDQPKTRKRDCADPLLGERIQVRASVNS